MAYHRQLLARLLLATAILSGGFSRWRAAASPAPSIEQLTIPDSTSTRIDTHRRRVAPRSVSASNVNNTLCGNGSPPAAASLYGVLSIPINVDSHSNEFLNWTIFSNHNINIETEAQDGPHIFYFTNPQDLLRASHGNETAASCQFKAGPLLAEARLVKPPNLSRRASNNSLIFRDCSQEPFGPCIDTLQAFSTSLSDAALREIGNSTGFACEISDAAILSTSDCGAVGDEESADNSQVSSTYGYDKALVLGPVIGAVGLVLVIIGVFLLLRYRRRRTQRQLIELAEQDDYAKHQRTGSQVSTAFTTSGGGDEGYKGSVTAGATHGAFTKEPMIQQKPGETSNQRGRSKGKGKRKSHERTLRVSLVEPSYSPTPGERTAGRSAYDPGDHASGQSQGRPISDLH